MAKLSDFTLPTGRILDLCKQQFPRSFVPGDQCSSFSPSTPSTASTHSPSRQLIAELNKAIYIPSFNYSLGFSDTSDPIPLISLAPYHHDKAAASIHQLAAISIPESAQSLTYTTPPPLLHHRRNIYCVKPCCLTRCIGATPVWAGEVGSASWTQRNPGVEAVELGKRLWSLKLQREVRRLRREQTKAARRKQSLDSVVDSSDEIGWSDWEVERREMICEATPCEMVEDEVEKQDGEGEAMLNSMVWRTMVQEENPGSGKPQ